MVRPASADPTANARPNADARRAVHEAVSSQRDQLLRVARRRGGGRVNAEDVLHLAVQHALERADQLRDPSRAEAWVGRVVRNLVTDELRKTHGPVVSSDGLEGAPIEDAPVGCACVVVQAAQLKREYAEILRRVVVEGVPVTVAASELGLTPGNAMVRLHRAREALKRRLVAHCGTATIRSCADCPCTERGCCALEQEPR